MSTYDKMNFKIPEESYDYRECSDYVINSMENIIHDAIERQINKIIINTNLKLGLPMENINKIAGPFIEAWAFEIFSQTFEDSNNRYLLINVETRKRLDKADIILQFKKKRKHEFGITAEVDVKATSEDIPQSGKSPNITSYARIRTAYLEDPDYLFVILSLKYRVYSCKNQNTQLMDGIMEVVGYKVYDLKYLSSGDISYNPALGTGQIQIKDIHYVTMEYRDVWTFCQLLDRKYLASGKRTLDDWIKLAKQNKWIKFDE
ncbi:MAG: hypothetical protein LBP87_15760 [Planctomycetaceae bacterium]|jgi:hypothetical protein|nr:hypothetical protein [Planctomycetaceae bacterium]